MKEKKLRIEDALNATKAAVEEGIVAGGGTAFVNAIPAVKALLDYRRGRREDRRAHRCQGPGGAHAPDRRQRRPRRLCHPGAASRTAGKIGYGYNASHGEFRDMIEAGIVDPTKVTRSALQNAASVAATMPDHREPGGRHQGARSRCCPRWRRHGRYVLIGPT